MRLGRNGILLLLIFLAAHAAAEPGHGRGSREAVRAFHVQYARIEREPRADQPHVPPPAERRERDRGFWSSGDDGQDTPTSSAEAPRRQGRLTPEERRALRRQIGEVGHDIYKR